MVVIEKDLRLAGLTIVFADGVAGPLIRGQSDLAADLAMMLAYHESGQFIPKHAERIIQAQRQLALGGSAPAATPPTASGAPWWTRRAPCPGAAPRHDGAPARLPRPAHPQGPRQDRRLALHPGAQGAGLGVQADRPAPQRRRHPEPRGGLGPHRSGREARRERQMVRTTRSRSSATTGPSSGCRTTGGGRRGCTAGSAPTGRGSWRMPIGTPPRGRGS